jgi:hypothetical protein
VKSNFREVRSSVPLEKHENFTIEDLTSSEFQAIDSLDKVMMVQKEILKSSADKTLFEHINNLLKWAEKDMEEKHKFYTKFFSHEMNLFLYFKDPEYFEKIARPFLVNKMEKTFVDFWLLN